MSGITVKSFLKPDETRPFRGKGKMEVVRLGDMTSGRGTFEPGWRWSQNVKPLAGTDSCQSLHVGYCLTGSMRIRMDDGEERDIRAGDAFTIEPGHDAWVTGHEDCVMLDFVGFEHYAEKSTRPSAEPQPPSIH